MKIKIDHIAKSEGHMGFMAHIIKGDIKSAKLEVHEGARLIEGLLIGRNYDEAPIITSRICGICPVVHNICSLKAMENALGIKISKQTKLLRELLLYAQIIQSHTLHLFMISGDKKIIPIRDFINKFLEIITGRAIHPLTTMIGGFRKLPDKNELEKLMQTHSKVLNIALKLIPKFKSQPNFSRKTEFRALSSIYGDEIKKMPLQTHETKKDIVLRTNRATMPGAIARLNLYNYKLNNIKLPCYNTFYNIYAQAVETVHYLKEIKRLLPKKIKLKNTKFKLKAGTGQAGCEAPRGTLYHQYEINKDGKILNAKIITPTAQFLNNLEADLKVYLKKDGKQPALLGREKAKDLIRAYDPCISCAVH